ncbi:MAG: hypothetical protein ACI8RD_002678 [Bacillariaceae sp.]|jgi:hypothetical protein
MEVVLFGLLAHDDDEKRETNRHLAVIVVEEGIIARCIVIV